MKFVFISDRTFEPWDWMNPDVQGIGGSETSHIEMSRRLAEHGHTVDSYAPVPWKGEVREGPGGVWWHEIESLRVDSEIIREADVIVIYRAPFMLDLFEVGQSNIWLICQDVDYRMKGNELTELRCSKLSRLVALCESHAGYLKAAHPTVADKVCVSSNGIKRAVIEDLLRDPPARNPHRLIYASSPDRGLEYLLQFFPRAKEIVPDLELHVYYGFNNIDKVVEWYKNKGHIAQNTARLRALIEQPGVNFHGRMGQPELAREWFKSGIWCHPSNFTETSCITCMDAQACGAVPITKPLWAVAENVKHGVFIDGDVRNPLIQARFVHVLVSLLRQPGLQDEIRAESMPWALDRFGWERFVQQWENWAYDAQTGSREDAMREAVPA